MLINKKGFSLLETVISLTILMSVFAGTITLVISTLNLAMITRDKTEATALAQKGLSDGVSKLNNCTGVNADYSETPVNGKTLRVDYIYTFSDIGSGSTKITSADFVLVKSAVSWANRGGNHQVVTSEYVRRYQ